MICSIIYLSLFNSKIYQRESGVPLAQEIEEINTVQQTGPFIIIYYSFIIIISLTAII